MTPEAKKLLQENPELCKEIAMGFYFKLGNDSNDIKTPYGIWTDFVQNNTSQKDWEILSFMVDGCKEWELVEDGSSKYSSGVTFIFDLRYFLNYTEECKIHSVKRLSDGAVFTVGEDCQQGKILKLEVSDNDMLATISTSTLRVNIILLDVKKPLFKTEDGVDVFEGDTVFFISTLHDGWKANSSKVLFTKESIPPYFKYFSTKEKCEEYIFNNKPIFSLKEATCLFERNMDIDKIEKFIYLAKTKQ